MSHAWNLSDGTFNSIPVNKRAKANVPRPSYIHHTHRAANGLTNLQLAHDAPITHCAMDVAIEHVWNMLPDTLRRFVLMLPPNGPALWSTDEEHLDRMYEKMKHDEYQVADSMGNKQFMSYTQFKKRPWVIWPIWVEDQFGSDWVTIFWYSVPSQPSEEGKAPVFDDITMYSIIDPRRETYGDGKGRHRPIQERAKRIAKRLHDLLTPGGFSMEHAEYKEILCPPMPQTEATSGERCYHVTKDLTRQLLEHWLIAGGQQPQYHDDTIQHIAKWVNPYGERIEMTGINAWQLMASFDYNARIAVESISRNHRINIVADGKKKYLYNMNLAGPFGEQLIADYDYALPNEGNPNGPQKPEEQQQQRTRNCVLFLAVKEYNVFVRPRACEKLPHAKTSDTTIVQANAGS
ncbi:hypothetical protein GGR57DRAFT_494881 [Xylariaceae sp. FL1272]|nr:hypothetical protein GGR57DRAFT_494881 [Xylariaceae sp. FL1272]